MFGDSLSDSGRRFNAPASFDFEDIGPFPWKKLFVAEDSEVRMYAAAVVRCKYIKSVLWQQSCDWLLLQSGPPKCYLYDQVLCARVFST